MVLLSLTDCDYLGVSLSQNPGFLKLRKIRAAQAIANTVRQKIIWKLFCELFKLSLNITAYPY